MWKGKERSLEKHLAELMFRALLLDISRWQLRLRNEWAVAEFVCCCGFPSLSVFNSMYERAGVVNPLYYDWLQFETDRMSWLGTILSCLQEQVFLWESTSTTYIVFWDFVSFIERLKFLFSILSFKQSESLEG